MTSLRISFVCLTLALVTGGASVLPEDALLALPRAWDGALRGICIAALAGFAVSFMVGLARTLQENQNEQAGARDARRS